MRLITSLFDYQRAAVDKLLHVKVGALYMEMGTGKTRTALELIQARLDAGKVKQVLWLCPYSVQCDLPELLSEHAEAFEEQIKIAGIESLSSSMRLNAELRVYVQQAPTYLVVDESLLVKNPFTYRTQNITDISKFCTYKLILNGTPISKNEADLFSQWYVLDWRILGYRSYYSFSANHLEMDEEHPDRVRRVLNRDYLARKIAPYTYECSKADVLIIPQKVYYDQSFYLTEEQEKHYADISERLLEQVNEFRPETIYRLFGALQAVTSGFIVQLNESGAHSTLLRMFPPEDNPRIQALLSVLSRIGSEQAVIYCKYTQEIEDICQILGENALPFYGEMSQAQRQQNKTQFKAGAVQFLVANKSCAQFGLNLQFCHNEVFYNNDWNWGTRAQAEDRLHRSGQTQDVHIWDVFASGTLDVTILRCLARKERMADLFKTEVASHNDSRNFLRAAIHGQLDQEVDHGKDIPAH
jgi:SNF2 family DNA or RNA helicase